MLVRGFPAAAFDTNCWVVAPAAGEECVVIDPGIGVEQQLDEVLRERQPAAGRGAAHARPPRPHLLRHPGLRRQGHPGLDPPGRPRAARRPDEGPVAGEPDDVRRPAGVDRARRRRPARPRRAARARRAALRRRLRARPHARLGRVPYAGGRRRGRGRAAGDVLRRRAVPGLHRTHRPARRLVGADAAVAGAGRADRAGRDRRLLRSRRRAPRSAASARPTRSCRTSPTRAPPSRGL